MFLPNGPADIYQLRARGKANQAVHTNERQLVSWAIHYVRVKWYAERLTPR